MQCSTATGFVCAPRMRIGFSPGWPAGFVNTAGEPLLLQPVIPAASPLPPSGDCTIRPLTVNNMPSLSAQRRFGEAELTVKTMSRTPFISDAPYLLTGIFSTYRVRFVEFISPVIPFVEQGIAIGFRKTCDEQSLSDCCYDNSVISHREHNYHYECTTSLRCPFTPYRISNCTLETFRKTSELHVRSTIARVLFRPTDQGCV
jgi:hypothetical protein